MDLFIHHFYEEEEEFVKDNMDRVTARRLGVKSQPDFTRPLDGRLDFFEPKTYGDEITIDYL